MFCVSETKHSRSALRHLSAYKPRLINKPVNVTNSRNHNIINKHEFYHLTTHVLNVTEHNQTNHGEYAEKGTPEASFPASGVFPTIYIEESADNAVLQVSD